MNVSVGSIIIRTPTMNTNQNMETTTIVEIRMVATALGATPKIKWFDGNIAHVTPCNIVFFNFLKIILQWPLLLTFAIKITPKVKKNIVRYARVAFYL